MRYPFGKQRFSAQSKRQARPVAGQFVDVHCHCLPGFDDGPESMADAIALCEALVADGITAVIATPHQLGRFDGCYGAAEIRLAVAELNRALANEGIYLAVVPGADVRVDERIPQLLESDRLLTLADTGKYILLELPQETFIDLQPLLAELGSAGLRVVISHPERNMFLSRQPKLLLKWAEYDPCLQITAASLVGGFGPIIQRAAWHFLDMPLAIVAATDAHDTNSRCPCMARAFELVASRKNRYVADSVCIHGPKRILDGEDVPVLSGPAEQERLP